MELKIEYVPIDSIEVYAHNAKLHPAEQIEQIKKSITEFGMNDPIGVFHDEIVEGHGRYIACQELGYTEVPVIRLDHLTDEEKRAYALVHNKLTMNSDFDFGLLEEELESLSFDMTQFGFDQIQLDIFFSDEEHEAKEKTDIENEIPRILVKCENDKQYADLLEFLNRNSIPFENL